MQKTSLWTNTVLSAAAQCHLFRHFLFDRNKGVENSDQLKRRSLGTLYFIKHNPHNFPNGTKIKNDQRLCYPHITHIGQDFCLN